MTTRRARKLCASECVCGILFQCIRFNTRAPFAEHALAFVYVCVRDCVKNNQSLLMSEHTNTRTVFGLDTRWRARLRSAVLGILPGVRLICTHARRCAYVQKVRM